MTPEGDRHPAAAAALVFVAVVGLLAWRNDGTVPVLSLVDLGFHELGHLLTYVFPDLVTAAMGSVTQVAVPAGLGVYFLVLRRDPVGTGVCWAWAGTSCFGVARYVADAPYEELELIGGDHDWAFILFELNRMDAADELATAVRVLGVGLLLAGAVVASRPWWPPRREPPPPPSLRGRITVYD